MAESVIELAPEANPRVLRTYASAAYRLSSTTGDDDGAPVTVPHHGKRTWRRFFRAETEEVKLHPPLFQDYWYTNKKNWDAYTNYNSTGYWRLFWRGVVNKILVLFGTQLQPIKSAKSYARNSCLFLPVLRPDNPFAMTWQLVMTLMDATYTAFVLPCIISFGEGGNSFYWFKLLAIITASIYLVDIIIQFHSGFIIEWEGKTRAIMDGDLVARHYVFHGYFFFDIISVLPIIVGYLMAVHQYPEMEPREVEATLIANDLSNFKIPDFQLLQLLRLVHLKRVYDVLRFASQHTGSHANAIVRTVLSTSTLYLFMAVYFFVLVLHLMGCLWIVVGLYTVQSYDENAWLRQVGVEDLSEAPNHEVYVASIYFIMTTITTIGYGDISAKNMKERVICLLLGPISVILFGIVVNGIGEVIALARASKDRSRLYRNYVAPMDAFFQLQSLDTHLLTDLKQYYSLDGVPATLIEQQLSFVNGLPPSLRSRVFLHLQEPILHSIPAISLLDEHNLRLLTSYLTFKCTAALQDVFVQGDAAENLYFLEEGTIAFIENGWCKHHVSSPCWIGETISLQGDSTTLHRHRFTARAKLMCQLWVVPVRRLRSLLGSSCPSFMEALVSSMDNQRQLIEPVADFDHFVVDLISSQHLGMETQQLLTTDY